MYPDFVRLDAVYRRWGGMFGRLVSSGCRLADNVQSLNHQLVKSVPAPPVMRHRPRPRGPYSSFHPPAVTVSFVAPLCRSATAFMAGTSSNQPTA